MRQHIVGLAASVLIGFTLVAADAEAARLGGGRNVGRQSSSAPQQASPQQAPQQGISQSQQAPSQAAAARPGTPAAAAAAQPARNRGSDPSRAWRRVSVWRPCSVISDWAPNWPIS